MNTSRVPVLALAAVALAGCGSTTSNGGSTPTSTATGPSRTASSSPSVPVVPMTPPDPACTAKMLRFSVSSGGAAAGNWYSNLVATNISHTACELYGVPAVAYVDRQGKPVGPQAAREPGHPLEVVTLKPGERAAAVLHQASPYNFDAAECSVVTTAGYAVAPRPHDRAVIVPSVGSTCARPKSTTFWVAPWTKTFHELPANP